MQTRIKEVRESKGITQEQLSAMANVSRTVLSQLENGSRPVVKSDTMLKISDALQTPIEELFLTKKFT